MEKSKNKNIQNSQKDVREHKEEFVNKYKENNEESKSKLKIIDNIKKSSKIAKILTTTGFSDIIQVNKWWEQPVEEDDSETKWTKLEHNGVLVAPRYEPHGIKILYKGSPIELKPYQEELATFWAGLANNDLSTKKITRTNFLKEFKNILDSTYKDSILDDFDFSPIVDYLENQREKNKNRTQEEKKVN